MSTLGNTLRLIFIFLEPSSSRKCSPFWLLKKVKAMMLSNLVNRTLLCLALFLATSVVADDPGHFPDRPSHRNAGKCQVCMENGRPCGPPIDFVGKYILSPRTGSQSSQKQSPSAQQIWLDEENRFQASVTSIKDNTFGSLQNFKATRWMHARYTITLANKPNEPTTDVTLLLDNNDECSFVFNGHQIVGIVAYVTKIY